MIAFPIWRLGTSEKSCRCAGSQAPALIVIHKWSKLVIPAWTAGTQAGKL